MNEKEAIKWLTLQRDKGVQWDEDSEEHLLIRVLAEERIKEAYNLAIEALKERKIGKWIPFEREYGLYECSECRKKISVPSWVEDIYKLYPYCRCGAKMIKEEK